MQNPTNEPVITFDADTRIITVPDELKVIGVAMDNNAETVTIEFPLSFDGIEWSEKVLLAIFENANGGMGTTELTKTIGTSKITATWAIPNGFTRYAGVSKFSLAVANPDSVTMTTNDNGEEVSVVSKDPSYFWSTLPAEMTVLSGLATPDKVLGTIDVKSVYEAISTLNETLEEFEALKTSFGLIQDSQSTLLEKITDIDSRVSVLENE